MSFIDKPQKAYVLIRIVNMLCYLKTNLLLRSPRRDGRGKMEMVGMRRSYEKVQKRTEIIHRKMIPALSYYHE